MGPWRPGRQIYWGIYDGGNQWHYHNSSWALLDVQGHISLSILVFALVDGGFQHRFLQIFVLCHGLVKVGANPRFFFPWVGDDSLFILFCCDFLGADYWTSGWGKLVRKNKWGKIWEMRSNFWLGSTPQYCNLFYFFYFLSF